MGGNYVAHYKALTPGCSRMLSEGQDSEGFLSVGHERGESSFSMTFGTTQLAGQVNEDGTFAATNLRQDVGIQGRFLKDSLIGMLAVSESNCNVTIEVRGKRNGT